MRTTTLLLFLPALLPLSACRSAYYSTMETFGVHKRDILVDEVEDGREDQAEAQEQFKDTYKAFQELTGAEGGELEEVYDDLAEELEDCEDAAGDVSARIDDIEQVADDLFTEWEGELDEMQNADLKSESKAMLSDTRTRYAEMIGAMQRSEAKMEPVLQSFRDHVTFLKHNLNAKAIASLQSKVPEIEDDVAALIADMEKSIAEADEFISAME